MHASFSGVTPLIYNTTAGSQAGNAPRLKEVIARLHHIGIDVDVALVQNTDDVLAATSQAVNAGSELILVSGGDGTVESAANGVIGTHATLGILPAGTRNNVARSLNIPLDLKAAVTMLRTGSVQRIGAGKVRVNGRQRWFLETFTVGLFSSLYPDADAIQKGNVGRIANLLTAFASAPMARFTIRIDGGALEMKARAYAMLGVNLPIVAGNFRLTDDISYEDDHLDVFIYDRLDKLDMLIYGFDVLAGMAEDPAIPHLRIHTLEIWCDPPLPVMADGFDLDLGKGQILVESAPRVLSVITGFAPDSQ